MNHEEAQIGAVVDAQSPYLAALENLEGIYSRLDRLANIVASVDVRLHGVTPQPAPDDAKVAGTPDAYIHRLAAAVSQNLQMLTVLEMAVDQLDSKVHV